MGKSHSTTHRCSHAKARRPRSRKCLRQGCPHRFRPRVYTARYCSDACRKKVRAWRRWKKRKEDPEVREQRRAQSIRYRERYDWPAYMREYRARRLDHSKARKGSPPSKKKPCNRPGCYELFTSHARSPHQKYCSRPCRNALRRLRDRLQRWVKRITQARRQLRAQEYERRRNLEKVGGYSTA